MLQRCSLPRQGVGERPLGSLARAAVVAALAVAAVGCAGADGGPPLGDAGPVPDGGYMLFDASFLDAAGDDGGGGGDGGPDAGPASCGGPCDPTAPVASCVVDQCLLVAAEPACLAPAGVLAAGAPCTDVGDCAPGLACFRKLAGGICGSVCCPGFEGPCAADERCGGPGVLVDETATSYRECLPRRPCDPLAGTGCEAGEACYFVSHDGLTDCREEGAATEGQSCAAPEDCAAGLSCLGAIDPTCKLICDDPSDCALAQVCVSAQLPGLPGVGHCL